MKRGGKWLAFLLACVLLVLGAGQAVYAASSKDDDSEEINGATISVKSETVAGNGLGTLEVTASSDRFHVDSYTFLDSSGEWKPGQVPKAKVVLRAEDGYRFSVKINSSKITVKGSGASCTALKRVNSGDAVELTLRLKAVSGTLGEVEDAYWVSNPIGKAKWDTAEYANAYQLRLYRNNTLVKTVDKTTTNSYDFYPYMTKEGVYIFHVRAVPRSTDEGSYLTTGEWQYSDELYIDRAKVSSGVPENSGASEPSEVSSMTGSGNHPGYGWVRDAKGWWYHQNDGTYPINQWSYIDNKWYLFDMGGYMKTGWQKWKEQDYYLTTNGEMVTGWLEDNKKWYYMDGSGVMKKNGWLQDGTNWYYLQSDGARVTGWRAIGNQWYYFYPENGIMAVNTTVENYYVNGDGAWVR